MITFAQIWAALRSDRVPPEVAKWAASDPSNQKLLDDTQMFVNGHSVGITGTAFVREIYLGVVSH